MIDATHAPITAANFLKYVDAKMYDGGRFHRAVRLDNQARKDVLMSSDPGRPAVLSRRRWMKGFGPIALERTSITTLRHVDGAISMARGSTGRQRVV